MFFFFCTLHTHGGHLTIFFLPDRTSDSRTSASWSIPTRARPRRWIGLLKRACVWGGDLTLVDPLRPQPVSCVALRNHEDFPSVPTVTCRSDRPRKSHRRESRRLERFLANSSTDVQTPLGSRAATIRLPRPTSRRPLPPTAPNAPVRRNATGAVDSIRRWDPSEWDVGR